MSINPYESPETSDPAMDNDAAAWVDGKYLVVTTGVALPQICVKTNQPVSDREYTRRSLSWCSPLALLLLLIGMVFYVVGYFLLRKKCEIAFGLARDVRRKYQLVLMSKIALTLLLLAVLVFTSDNLSILVFAIVIFIFLISFFAMFFGNSPLSIHRYSKGAFWIKGFSKEFLADLEL